VYVFARGPVGGFSGVYLPVRTPESWEQISAENEIEKKNKKLDWASIKSKLLNLTRSHDWANELRDWQALYLALSGNKQSR
jgi:hypothetical protein